jgi:hypothetical protein
VKNGYDRVRDISLRRPRRRLFRMRAGGAQCNAAAGF